MAVFDRFRLDGKRALVTGGSRGLGRAMATAMAEAGADIVLAARDPDVLEKTAEEIRRVGRRVETLAGDFSDPSECERIVGEALASHGPIHILVNNVGGRRIPTPTVDLATADWLKILDLNMTSTFVATRMVGRAMIDRGTGGRIINIASVSALIALRSIGGRSYEAAKAAVIQFSRVVAADWAPHGITVNIICPGMFMTDINLRWAKERPEVIEAFRAGIPAGVFGEPEDIGPLAVYLASDASRYMTGATLVIDGGYTLW